MAGKLEVKQIRSVAGATQNQRRNLKALGLRRREYVVVHDDTPIIRGMIKKVAHMVRVTER
ncbi:MAG: 50S ribosomal protein L30 [Candidatus Zixiibacteriota bacterium]|nr:MAG: 50S ribosomal protein L30 [candidate division Zixibacteria bacterium]